MEPVVRDRLRLTAFRQSRNAALAGFAHWRMLALFRCFLKVSLAVVPVVKTSVFPGTPSRTRTCNLRFRRPMPYAKRAKMSSESQPFPVFNAPREQVRGRNAKPLGCLMAVHVHGPAGDAKPLGDLLGRRPRGEQVADLPLPVGQVLDTERDWPAKSDNRHAPDASLGERDSPASHLGGFAIKRLGFPAGDAPKERGLAANGVRFEQVCPRELPFQLVELVWWDRSRGP
jgi:hypothetical protein